MHYTNILSFMKRVLLLLLVFCFTISSSSAYAAPLYKNLDYAPPKCDSIKEDTLSSDLTRVVNDFFTNEATATDIQSIVERKWLVLGIDSVINSEVDKAVSRVKRNTGYWGRFTSNWSPGQAEKLAQEIAGLAFNDSTYLKSSLQELSESVAQDLSLKLETSLVKSSSYAMDCLQQFIRDEYSQTVVGVFGKNLQDSMADFENLDVSYQPETLSFVRSHKFGFGGASYLLIKNVIAKRFFDEISNRVVQQVAKRIGARIAEGLIPIVDLVVFVQTIFDFANPDATLHQIQESLKDSDIKQNFRTEIADSVEQQLYAQSPEIAGLISNAVYSEWKDFTDRSGRALRLAKESPEFNKILEKHDLAKVSKLLEVLQDNSGQDVLQESIQDGSFEKLLALPGRSYRILTMRDSSPALLLKWVDLAGARIEDVVTLELYKHFSPEELDRQLLAEVLDLKDSSIITKLSLLEVDAIRKLFLISKPNLISVAAHFSSQDLRQLSEYLGQLDSGQVNQLLKLIDENPSVIKEPSAIEHILQSQDFDAALHSWGTGSSLFSLVGDISLIFTKSISWKLFLDKYGFLPFFLIISVPVLFMLAIVTWFYRQWLEILQKQRSLGD